MYAFKACEAKSLYHPQIASVSRNELGGTNQHCDRWLLRGLFLPLPTVSEGGSESEECLQEEETSVSFLAWRPASAADLLFCGCLCGCGESRGKETGERRQVQAGVSCGAGCFLLRLDVLGIQNFP